MIETIPEFAWTRSQVGKRFFHTLPDGSRICGVVQMVPYREWKTPGLVYGENLVDWNWYTRHQQYPWEALPDEETPRLQSSSKENC